MRTRHNRGRGGRSSRANRAARKAARTHVDAGTAYNSQGSVVVKDYGHGADSGADSDRHVGNHMVPASYAGMHGNGETSLSSGTSILARTADQPEVKVAEQSSFNGATVQIRWSKGQALLKVEVDQQAMAAGVHSLVATSTFGTGLPQV